MRTIDLPSKEIHASRLHETDIFCFFGRQDHQDEDDDLCLAMACDEVEEDPKRME